MHESQHVVQWATRRKWWNGFDEDMIAFWAHVEGEKVLEPGEAERCARRVMELEADCERRVVRWIKRAGLPISSETYARLANVYLLRYPVAAELGSWVNLNPPLDGVAARRMPGRIAGHRSAVPAWFREFIIKHGKR